MKLYFFANQSSISVGIKYTVRDLLFDVNASISISIYFVQNQVGLQSQKTNEQDNQAHNMLSQLPAATDRQVKQQYNWKKLHIKQTRPNYKLEF